jgi:hypothetical protein
MADLAVDVTHHAPASHGHHRLTPLARLRNFPIVMAAIEICRAAGRPRALRLRLMNVGIHRRRVADAPIPVEETA